MSYVQSVYVVLVCVTFLVLALALHLRTRFLFSCFLYSIVFGVNLFSACFRLAFSSAINCCRSFAGIVASLIFLFALLSRALSASDLFVGG